MLSPIKPTGETAIRDLSAHLVGPLGCISGVSRQGPLNNHPGKARYLRRAVHIISHPDRQTCSRFPILTRLVSSVSGHSPSQSLSVPHDTPARLHPKHSYCRYPSHPQYEYRFFSNLSRRITPRIITSRGVSLSPHHQTAPRSFIVLHSSPASTSAFPSLDLLDLQD